MPHRPSGQTGQDAQRLQTAGQVPSGTPNVGENAPDIGALLSQAAGQGPAIATPPPVQPVLPVDPATLPGVGEVPQGIPSNAGQSPLQPAGTGNPVVDAVGQAIQAGDVETLGQIKALIDTVLPNNPTGPIGP